jgi:ATP-binding cassette subfamily B protein
MNGAMTWPVARAAEGLELLARSARLPLQVFPTGTATAGTVAEHDVPAAAARLGLEAEAVDTAVSDVEALVRLAAPAVLRLGSDALLMLVARRGSRVTIVRPDHHVVTVPQREVIEALVEPERAPLVIGTERIVDDIGIRSGRRDRVVRALIRERLRSRRIRAGWLIRIPQGASFRSQLAAAGARRLAWLLVAAHVAQYGIALGAWWLLGRAALQGHLDRGWLAAWALALATVVPLQVAALWIQGRLAIVAGALLKQRLLAGALRLEPEEIRHEGAGQLLGRVIEAEAVESMALGGGLIAGLAGLELLLAGVVLSYAAPLLAGLLLLWIAASAALGWIYFQRRRAWVRQRVALTHDLIERMLGHRTRLAQERREHWHDGEDEALERYVQASSTMDRSAVWLLALVPRGWMLVGLCGLTPMFVGGSSAGTLAVALGGILLGFRALDRLTNGLWSATGAAIAWQQTAPVFRAAARAAGSDQGQTRVRPGSDQGQTRVRPGSDPGQTRTPAVPVLDATDVKFTHHGRLDPVLRGCTLTIASRDRLILQGESGGGKSTLASILSGLRAPQSGLVLLHGVDRHTLGAHGWRSHVVLVPQFHENHLVLGTVAFNALMGGDWPPAAEDFGRAENVLRQLGLGGTLDRMPSGILQTVGETGWQLSHGERSRLYLARALLQDPDLLILDESFAQLDPATMQLALDVVISRNAAVLLIAHP